MLVVGRQENLPGLVIQISWTVPIMWERQKREERGMRIGFPLDSNRFEEFTKFQFLFFLRF